MESLESFKKDLFNTTEINFESKALELFRLQAEQNLIYKKYLHFLDKEPSDVHCLNDIPFLPIEFFKTQIVKTGKWQEEKIFKSSGTTKTGRSQHFIQDLNFYHNLSLNIAEIHFGSLSKLKIIALLPSYLEQGDSSLVSMMDHFIRKSASDSSFLLHNNKQLIQNISASHQKVLLLGVSYALLDLAEDTDIDLSEHLVIETGGMKGRKKEITRNELHLRLKEAFNSEIYTEYGMTEMLSQAYGLNGHLHFPDWCKPLVRDLNDPFLLRNEGSGALNIIDLANSHSCAFIETKDLVRLDKKGHVEVLGRMDNSDIRGCSLLL